MRPGNSNRVKTTANVFQAEPRQLVSEERLQLRLHIAEILIRLVPACSISNFSAAASMELRKLYRE
jgi:hypothetical protein